MCSGVRPRRPTLTLIREDKALVVQGDEDQSSTSDVTTFPDAIACLSELYDLNLYGNNLASIPALGSAGLGLVKLGIIDLSNNQIATLAADTFLGQYTTHTMLIDTRCRCFKMAPTIAILKCDCFANRIPAPGWVQSKSRIQDLY